MAVQPAEARKACTEKPVEIDLHGLRLGGLISVPEAPLGMVLFAHGAGSSRFSRRNRMVAATLLKARLGSLLMDLLTGDEIGDMRAIFDVEMLAGRVEQVAAWLEGRPEGARLPLGLFGASTGAAASLIACARKPGFFKAVVSRGGWPDLADAWLPLVDAPTLLVVGGNDREVLQLNRQARERLAGIGELVEIAGASHLFEEPGTLEEVALLARDWFFRHLAGGHHR